MDGRAMGRRFLRRSKTLSNLGVRLEGRYEALRDRKLTDQQRWQKRTVDELRYWSEALQSELYADRLNPLGEVEATCLRRALAETAATNVSILDVGSGPLTVVGHVYPGKKLSIFPTDALGSEYVKILRSCGIDAPVEPIACSGEQLPAKFSEGTFDIAFSQNALDHSKDPLSILSNMIALIKPTGRVALKHFRNEGEQNSYGGMHFWNIDFDNGAFVFWNRETRHDISALLATQGYETECWFETDPQNDEHEENVHCLIRPIA